MKEEPFYAIYVDTDSWMVEVNCNCTQHKFEWIIVGKYSFVCKEKVIYMFLFRNHNYNCFATAGIFWGWAVHCKSAKDSNLDHI